jgi:hypothetical protein
MADIPYLLIDPKTGNGFYVYVLFIKGVNSNATTTLS